MDALSGAPGIFSARYAGIGASDQDNVNKLLVELEGVVSEDRTARFICVLVLIEHANDPVPVIAHGIWEGRDFSQVTALRIPSKSPVKRDSVMRRMREGTSIRPWFQTLPRGGCHCPLSSLLHT